MEVIIMNCNCNRTIRAVSYNVGSSFNIMTDYSINEIDNGEHFILTLPIDLPAMTTIVPVYVSIKINGNQTYIPVQDIVGNNLMSDQLRYFPEAGSCQCNMRGVARLVYGANPAHFKVLFSLPQSSAVEYEEASETTVTTNSTQGGTTNGTTKTKQS
jgi:hypothetical protein